MIWLLYGLNLFWRALVGAIMGLFALIAWSARSFARLSPLGKLITLLAAGILTFAISNFDVPLLEPRSARSVSEAYVRPEFDPEQHETEQAAQEEHERTKEFPLYMYEMCGEIITDGPGPQEYWRAFSALSDRPITYKDALQILDTAETDCAQMGVMTSDLHRVRAISKRSKILFD